ncbi:hypothetical protein EHS25_004926 [Saitozyma podzolica]|uniref:ABC transporter family G domain-containing protein n=1 Tax=Saitozyma podzolica TaxID=1890683 RepID=A0A427Y350_9TREE|nr:hypothetical protein EHS25_004926 [Saitozyma podzolica]
MSGRSMTSSTSVLSKTYVLIGIPDMGGLGVEERKRVTFGVELAARPEFLLFVEEPTSGLDSQMPTRSSPSSCASLGCPDSPSSAPPSGDLFEMFDAVLFLVPGGKTVYAGETGPGAQAVCKYFGRLGAPCPLNANPAEYILGTVAPVGGSKIDWPRLWRESPEAKQLL